MASGTKVVRGRLLNGNLVCIKNSLDGETTADDILPAEGSVVITGISADCLTGIVEVTTSREGVACDEESGSSLKV